MKVIIDPSSLQYLLREKNNHGACFTVKSLATGKDYTYKVDRSEFNEKWYTHVKIEKEYQEFIRLGTYNDGKITNKKEAVLTQGAKAIAWILKRVELGKFDELKKSVEVMHLGNCIVCGRTLTDADSIQRGVGPVCMTK